MTTVNGTGKRQQAPCKAQHWSAPMVVFNILCIAQYIYIKSFTTFNFPRVFLSVSHNLYRGPKNVNSSLGGCST